MTYWHLIREWMRQPIRGPLEFAEFVCVLCLMSVIVMCMGMLAAAFIP